MDLPIFRFGVIRLIRKHVGHIKLDIYVFITITQLKPLMVYDGLLIPEGIIRPVVSVSALTWFIRYIYYWNLEFLSNVIIIKTKVLLPQVLWLFCWGPLILLLTNTIKLFGFPIFRFSAVKYFLMTVAIINSGQHLFNVKYLFMSIMTIVVLHKSDFFFISTPPFFSFWNITVLWSNTTQIVITHICVIFSRRQISLPISWMV